MRWLLLLLLTVNVVLFGVQLKESEKDEIGLGFVAEEGVEAISLLKEEVRRSEDNLRCLVIGELESNDDLGVLTSYLTQRKIRYEVVRNEKNLAPQFWVYVEGVSEKEGGVLKKKNIKYFVISAGELKGAYSLGLFKNVDLAKALIAELNGYGITAKIQERKQVEESLWLSIKMDQIVDAEQLIEAINALKINVSEIKEFFCKSIASEK